MAFVHLGPDKPLVFTFLAKIDALDTASVDHGRLRPLMQVLVAVNVSKGDVVPGRIGQGTERYDRVVPHHHNALFRTQNRIRHTAVHR